MQPLRAWLKANRLTADPSDYTAVPDLNGTYNVRSLVEALQAEGMEIQAETAVDIITRFNRKAAELTTSGYSVNTGLVVMQPRIRGKFTNATFDPQKHKVYISVRQGVAMRKAIADATVEIQGEQESKMTIYLVEDLSNDTPTNTLTKGKNARILGSMVKIDGEDPSVGVTFTNTATKTATRVDSKDVIRNKPSELIILVPDTLAAGKYEVSVTTQYGGGNKPLKTPRKATYKGEITIA